MMSRLIAKHYALNAHLFRIGVVDTNLYHCKKGYQDADRIIWDCAEYTQGRNNLLKRVEEIKRTPCLPIRDILGSRDYEYLYEIYTFF